MMTIDQFRKKIPFGSPIELYRLLDSAMTERGATADAATYFRFCEYHEMRSLIDRLYFKLTNIAKYFLVDPRELDLEKLIANNIRCYDLPLLAQKRGCSFLVPVSTQWRTPSPLQVRHYYWPQRSLEISTTDYPRPHQLPRLYGEYFLQAAEMMKHLRYYAPDALKTSITIPAFAAGNSRSCVFVIFINRSSWDTATQYRIQQVWNGYLAPGRYKLDFFNQSCSEEFPSALFAGYIDLFNNLQFFTT